MILDCSSKTCNEVVRGVMGSEFLKAREIDANLSGGIKSIILMMTDILDYY